MEETNVQELIRVSQLPVIEEHLRTTKESVDNAVSNALNLVCTPDTIQCVKGARASLNKRFKELESQRMIVKKAVLGPYEDFEKVYKECVSDAFRDADARLKEKISFVEDTIKANCEKGLREYFGELCEVYGVDFLRYEQTGVKVDMASAKAKAPVKLRSQLSAFVARVAESVDAIADLDYAEEILVEFKKSLNPTEAISTVTNRHKQIEAEKAAAQAREERETARKRAKEKAEHVIQEQAPAIMEPATEGSKPEPSEPVLTCVFKVKATKAELMKIKNFLEKERIAYE